MSLMHISPSEMQYGIRTGYADRAGLTGISVGANDVIIEILIKNYIQDVAFCTKLAAGRAPSYFAFGSAAWANYIEIYNSWNANKSRIVFLFVVPFIGQYIDVAHIYDGSLHMFVVIRAASCNFFMNGHSVRSAAKAAHNINTVNLRLFANGTIGGIATPSTGCMNRIYIGDFSGFTDAQLLAIHRKYLRTPFITPLELAPYEAFRFTGRQPDGSQILAASTNVYNEAPLSAGYGETLAIQGGLNWGQIREPIWTPR